LTVEEEQQREEGTNDLQELADELLGGKVYKLPKERKIAANSGSRKSTGSSNNNNDNGSSAGGNGKANSKGKNAKGKDQGKQQQEEIEKKVVYLQKYCSAKEGLLAESVLIGGRPYFLVSKAKGLSCIEVHSSLELAEEVLKPCEPSSYINLPYEFESEAHLRECIDKAKKETLDSLFTRDKTIWRKYVDGDDFHISIAAADEIYSYFQDKVGLTHYLFFTGGNNSGKSNNLTKIHYTAYRNMMSTDVTAANIYQFLGSREDEGHGTICEDEADNLDESPDKMRIYKNGYTTGFPVLRTDTSFGRRQQKFNTFCFKAYSAERTPDAQKAKGFIQRIIEINCYAGNPPYDISEIVNPAGDQENQALLDELMEFRNTLLLYRLLHFHEPLPDVKDLNIHNREKQLFKPVIRLFQNADCLDELLNVISDYLSQRRAANVDNLHAMLFKVIYDMAVKNAAAAAAASTTELEQKEIWIEIVDALEAEPVESKPDTYHTNGHGIISKKATMKILRDVFGGKSPRRHGSSRMLVFDKARLEKLEKAYIIKDIEVKVKRGSISSSSSADAAGLDSYTSTTFLSNVVKNEESLQNGTDGTDGTHSEDATHIIQQVDDPNSLQIPQETSENNSGSAKEIVNISTENESKQSGRSKDLSHASHASQFECYHCGNFQSTDNKDYERHVVLNHPSKPAYPCKMDLERHPGMKAQGKSWEI
jgi:hypothetical protein